MKLFERLWMLLRFTLYILPLSAFFLSCAHIYSRQDVSALLSVLHTGDDLDQELAFELLLDAGACIMPTLDAHVVESDCHGMRCQILVDANRLRVTLSGDFIRQNPGVVRRLSEGPWEIWLKEFMKVTSACIGTRKDWAALGRGVLRFCQYDSRLSSGEFLERLSDCRVVDLCSDLVEQIESRDSRWKASILNFVMRCECNYAGAGIFGRYLSSEDVGVRAVAWKAIEYLHLESLAQEIRILLSHKDMAVRALACEYLLYVGNDADLRALQRKFMSEEPYAVKLGILRGLRQFGKRAYFSELISGLEDEELRWDVVSALGDIGTSECVASLRRILKISDGVRRASVLAALAECDPAEAAAVCMEYISDRDSYVASVAIQILARSKEGGHRKAAFGMAANPDPLVRAAVASGLMYGKTTGDSHLLSKLLGDSEVVVVNAAFYSLAKLRDERSIRFARHYVGGKSQAEDLIVLADCLKLLGSSGCNDDREALAGHLRSGHPDVRYWASSALCELGDEKGAKCLVMASDRSLFYLNAFVNKASWQKMRDTVISQVTASNWRGAIEEICLQANERVAFPKPLSSRQAALLNAPCYGLRDFAGISALEGLGLLYARMNKPGNFGQGLAAVELVFDGEGIKIMHRDNARAYFIRKVGGDN